MTAASLGGHAPTHRLRPVLWGSLAVLATYAAFQLVVAWSATTSWWWKSEWQRRNLHARYPKVSIGPQQPVPAWENWLPSALTAVVLIGALVVLALAMVSAGRGWWLVLVAALPLIPAQIAPGVWAPELSNQVLCATVWPAGDVQPSIAWSWLSAGVEALVIALPAVALSAVVLERRPALFCADVVRRLAPLAVAVAAVALWNSRAGQQQDWVGFARTAAWVMIGGLLLSGGLRRRWAVPLLVLVAAVASGMLRWTTGIDGTAEVAVDPGAWTVSAVAALGGVWVLVAPAATWPLRRWRSLWRAMLATDLQRRATGPSATAVHSPAAGPAGDVTPRPSQRVSHRAPSAPVGASGRHRA